MWILFKFYFMLGNLPELYGSITSDWQNIYDNKLTINMVNDGVTNSLPFTELSVIDADNSCGEIEQSIFSTRNWDNFIDQTWYGMNEGCKCYKVEDGVKTDQVENIFRRKCTFIEK